MEHITNQQILSKRVKVALIGAGGNGSQMLTGLARLHHALVSLGHPGGLHVTVFDDDSVSESNIGRQLFSSADIGLNKGVVLTHRVNAFFGLDWRANPTRFGGHGDARDFDLLISCVDTKASRRDIHNAIADSYSNLCYLLDLGNRSMDGQVILGEPPSQRALPRFGRKSDPDRLPVVTELYPEILDTTLAEDDDTPSCSLAEALEKQSLFINQAVVTFALDLLFTLFRKGKITHHGAFVNLESGRVSPLAVDVEVWKRMNPLLYKKSRHQKNGGERRAA